MEKNKCNCAVKLKVFNGYKCPECNKLLFTDEGKAEVFINDTDELKEIVRKKIEKIRGKKK